MANPIPLVVNDDSGAPAGAIPVDIYGVDSGGAVDSVNGQTGAVTLDASDVGAQPAGSYATQNDLNALIQRVEALENAEV